MSAERFNPETPEPNSSVVQPEGAAPFRVPLMKEDSTERKSRRRKKRKKNAAAQQGRESTRPASKAEATSSSTAGIGKGNFLKANQGELTIWQRPEDTIENRQSAAFGNKVVEAVHQSDKKTEADEPKTHNEQVATAAGTVLETRTDESQRQLTEEQAAKESQLTAERPTVPPAAEQRLVPGQPLEFHQQPMIQHQGRELPPDPPGEGDKNVSSSEALPPTQHSHGGEMVPPPLQPPDPQSYRRRFWSEGASPHDASDRGSLPPLHDYERLSYEAHDTEPPYPAASHRIEAPAAVPTFKRFESDIPPGYQRTPGDVSRGAWTGLIAGWWLGRRGKRKAVERARKAGIQEGMAKTKLFQPPIDRPRAAEQYATPRLEAEPIHSYQAPEGGRRVVRPLSTEAHNPLRPPERAPDAVVRVAERMASPMASVAVFERAVRQPDAAHFEVPFAARAAAVKAAESVVGRPAEMPAADIRPALGARSERQLGKRELMKLSKDIKVDGVPIKEIYKANRIDEEGLRAVVDTYLKGGDIRQQLAQEVAVKEQSYERDPVLRHQRMMGERERQPFAHYGEVKKNNHEGFRGGGVVQSVGRTLSSVAASAESTAKSAGRALASGAKTAQRDIIDNSNTADWMSITAVVVLYSIILILLLS